MTEGGKGALTNSRHKLSRRQQREHASVHDAKRFDAAEHATVGVDDGRGVGGFAHFA